MESSMRFQGNKDAVNLCVFSLGEENYGIDITKIQEIRKPAKIAKAPMAPDCVDGILNLRGTAVTVIDLAKKIGLPEWTPNDQSRIIIVDSQGECIGLAILSLADIIEVSPADIEPPPGNLNSEFRKYLEGVVRDGSELVNILKVETILAV